MRYALLLVSLLLTGHAHASLGIDRSILAFQPGNPPRQDVIASNSGDTNLFLEVEVLEVTNPGTDQEQRTIVRDPESIGFIAAPRRLMVPPGGRRPIRLMNLNGHGDVERVYRVNVKPVMPPAESRGMGVRLIVAYQVLVFVAPKKSVVSLDSRREGNKLTLINNGNVNILLSNGEQCPMVYSQDCDPVNGTRLYPGNRAVIELPRPAPAEFDVEADGKRLRQRF